MLHEILCNKMELKQTANPPAPLRTNENSIKIFQIYFQKFM